MQGSSRPSKKQAKKQKQAQKLKQKQRQQQKSKGKGKQVQSQQQQQEEAFNLNNIQSQNNEQIVDVNFLVAQINDEHYHSIKTVLTRFGEIFNIQESQIANIIVDQNHRNIGNITLAEDDSDSEQEQENQQENVAQIQEDDQDTVYSILTIIPGTQSFVKAIKKQAINSAKNAQNEKILKLQTTSLLINQRLPNLPPVITTSYHQVFVNDMKSIREEQPEKYKSACSGYLLIVSQVEPQGKNPNLDTMIFKHFQYYQLCQKSKNWWLGLPKKSDQKHRKNLHTLYILIKTQDYFSSVPNFKNYLEQ